MEGIVDLLVYKLSSKGLTPAEIPRLVKDVLIIVSNGGEFTPGTINRKPETLGWDKTIVDSFTFELIIALPEDEGKHETKSSSIH
jgi:hypothetical protein